MTRLPSVGGDNGEWGEILNDFLSVEHNADGTLKRGPGIAQAQADAASAFSAAQDAKTAAEKANSNSTVASYVTSAGDTRNALDGRYAAQDAIYGPTDASLICAPSSGNQGLTFDGTYFWWGNDDGTSTTLTKIDPVTGAVVASYPGPAHAAGGDFHYPTGRLFFISGGTNAADLWEIDSATGVKLRSWDFSTLDWGGSALVGIDDTDPTGNTAYIFTSDYSTFAFKISRVILADNGTWSGAQLMFTSNSLGVAQGMCCRNGYVYYLCDSNGQRVVRYVVSGAALTEDRRWRGNLSGESEGLTFYQGALACGMRGGAVGIYRYPMIAENRPAGSSTFTSNVIAPGIVSSATPSVYNSHSTYPVTLGNPRGALGTVAYLSDVTGAAYAVSTGGYNLTFAKQVGDTWVPAMTLVGSTAANSPVGVQVAGYLSAAGAVVGAAFNSGSAAVFAGHGLRTHAVNLGITNTPPDAGTTAYFGDVVGASYALSTGHYDFGIYKQVNDAAGWYPAMVVNGAAAANQPQGVTVYTGNKTITAKITPGNLALPESDSSITLASPNGSKWNISVSDAGQLTVSPEG